MSGARPAAMTSHSADCGSPATVNVTPSSPVSHLLHEDAGANRDALLLEAALGDLRDVGVLGRQHAVEALVEGDVAAQAGVGGGDLGARRAGADDRERLGQPLQRPRLLGADDVAAELGAGSGFFTEPVARMTNFAAISVPSKLPPTLTLASSVTTP